MRRARQSGTYADMDQASPSTSPQDAQNGPAKRGRTKRQPVIKENLLPPNGVQMLQNHLQRLRQANQHHNRILHLDSLFVALLYAFYNPTCRSLRTLEGLGDVCQEELGIDSLCRSTTAEALAAFDPALLLPIINDLRARLPALSQKDDDLALIVQQVIAADGSYFNTYADVAWAIHTTRRSGKPGAQFRLDLQIDVGDWTATALQVSGKDDASETAAAAQGLKSGAIYLVDRNFIDFSFLTAVLDKESDFVVRCRDNAPAFSPQQQLPLSAAAEAAGVVDDHIGTLTGRNAPQNQLRQLTLCDLQNRKCIRILTSLLELPAETISILYRRRWQIELFFRWLKVWGNFKHLLSHSRNGLTLQFYVAVIGVLLTYLATGRRVSKYAISMLSFVAAGQTTLERIMPFLEKRERERELERARLARKKAQKLGQ